MLFYGCRQCTESRLWLRVPPKTERIVGRDGLAWKGRVGVEIFQSPQELESVGNS